MRIARAGMQARADALDDLGHFYGERLGLAVARSHDRLAVEIGSGELVFAPAGAGADPFHHFALLIPGNRFEAAHAWIGERATVLPGRDGSTVFGFAFWDAVACYFHDPAGNIVELIAHRGMEEAVDDGP